MKPAEAVSELAKVPTEPLMQMKWAKGMLAQAQDAERAILMRHAIGFAGQGPETTPLIDDHQDHMAALMANSQGSPTNG